MTAPRRSIRRSLLLWLLAPLFVLSVLLLAENYFETIRRANVIFDRTLGGSALAIADRVVVGQGGAIEVDVPYVALDMLTSVAEDRVFYKVAANGTTVTGYQDLPLPETRLSIGEDPVFFDATFRGVSIRVAAITGAASDATRSIAFTVVVAETTEGRAALARQALTRSALRILALISLAALLVWVGVRRGLAPLERLVEAVGRRSQDDLRPIEHETPEEVVSLVHSINGLIARLSEAIGTLKRFTGNAGHQLRTPLSIIRANIELARRSNDPAEAKQMLAAADRAALDAERLVEQFLLLARVEASRAHDDPLEVIDLNALAEETARDRAPAAVKAGLDLEFEPAAGRPRVRANPILIRELLLNILNNAIFHAAPCAAIVRVRRDGVLAVIEVEDDGPGMPEPAGGAGLQVADTAGRTAQKRGPGLGIAIATEIADRFGGRLEIGAGNAGTGTKVAVFLPLVEP